MQRTDYKVPFFDHQWEIIKKDPRRTGLWLGTGSGKTRTAAALAKGKTLVICPKTQKLDDTWVKEWKLQGKRLGYLTVMSKEEFRSMVQKGKSIYARTVIIDEAHTVAGVTPYTRQKNYVKYPKTSQLFEAVDSYLKEMDPERLYLLTATPDGDPMKIWALGRLLGAKWDFFRWRDIFYFEKTVRNRLLYLVKRNTETKSMLAKITSSLGYVGRLEDWFDVPDQVFITKMVELPPYFKERLQELKMDFPDPLVLTGKVHQLEQGIFGDVFLKEYKIPIINDYLNEFKKVVIFCRYTKQIEAYRDYFKGRAKTFVLNGKTKEKERKTMMDEAEKEDFCVFISQSQVSAGWELPGFPVVIFASMDHSFTNYEQALGRVQRVKNIKKNIYIFLVAGAADKAVKYSVDHKKNYSDAKFALQYGDEICQQDKKRK